MKYFLSVFCGGIPVSISVVRHDRQFYPAVSRALYSHLVSIYFTIQVFDEGIMIESNSIPERFVGSTIPFVFGNRKLELRVYPETLS